MGKKQQTNTDSEYGESLPVTSHLRAGFYTRFFKTLYHFTHSQRWRDLGKVCYFDFAGV